MENIKREEISSKMYQESVHSKKWLKEVKMIFKKKWVSVRCSNNNRINRSNLDNHRNHKREYRMKRDKVRNICSSNLRDSRQQGTHLLFPLGGERIHLITLLSIRALSQEKVKTLTTYTLHNKMNRLTK